MATLQDIADALKNAHAAGDTASAQKLADAYVAMQGAQAKPQADTAADSAARGLPPLQMQPQRTGYAAQVGAAMAQRGPNAQDQKQSGPQPLTAGLVGERAGQAATGMISNLLGIPGGLQQSGIPGLVPAVPEGQPRLPTGSEIGNYMAGPTDEQGQLMRDVGGLAGPWAGLKVLKVPGAVGRAVAGSGALPAAQEVRAAGYVVPPNMAQEKPSFVSKALSAWGGKVKVQQAASEKNQQITNVLAARELGLDPKTQLSDQAFKDVRAEAGKAYSAVAQAIPIVRADEKFANEVSNLGNRTSEAAKHFPGIVENSGIENLVTTLQNAKEFPPQAALDVVRQLRAEAGSNLKAFDDPAKKALGSAQRHAADALDDLVERNVAQTGNATLMQNYRDARQLIAKSHDIESATNTATGDVSARDLARLADRGRPLTGGLATIAKAGGAFPKATQDVAKFGGTESHSVLDTIGALGSGAAGHYGLAAGLLGRPIGRAAVLSNPYQNAVLGAARNANVAGGGIDPRLLGMMSPQILRGLLSAQTPSQ